MLRLYLLLVWRSSLRVIVVGCVVSVVGVAVVVDVDVVGDVVVFAVVVYWCDCC